MSIPVWVLLGFAGWTLLTLIGSLGSYRVGKILAGRARAEDFSFPDLEKNEWHRRAQRAHLNCVENLPIYGAIVVAIVATGLTSPTLDRLAIVFLIARVLHTLIHLGFKQTELVTRVRFTFFTVQLVCMIWMGVFVATRGA